MEGLRRSETAELALGALISFIAIMITSTVLAAMMLLIVQTTFSNSHEHSVTQSETLNGIIQVNRFELSAYSNPGADGLYLVFEFPYILGEVPDTEVVWSLLCGSPFQIQYISGNFDTATQIFDDGLSAATNDFFTDSGMYHIFISTSGVCDLSPNTSAELVIAVNGGRTMVIPFDVGSNPHAGMIFI
ncbi:hypothetical protein OAM96_02935 [Candidatus Poseidoniaceae archaeon]|nr:hypothetical protein [Candidatus Poseidoniaceae archaeon]|tara:strand:- start:696 stop:1259 length:564 start_codon:yes stop_codon:yes gene_type:complete